MVKVWKQEEEDNWWLFNCNIGDLSGKEQARFFRVIKGYKHVDRRTDPPKVDEKKGMIDKYLNKYIGGGSFLVKCFESETFEIVKMLQELKVTWKLYKCMEIACTGDDDERPED